MVQKIALTTVLTVTLLGAATAPAYAVNTPSFPSCVNPQGNLKASYDSGTHGVIGMTDEKKGSDKVYQLVGNLEVMQCYCPENGNGIQTNWWRIDGKSDTEIQELKNDGWIYVADGSAWGLDEGQYVAKNSDYSCKKNEEKKEEKKEEVQGIKEVLNLASTGNSAFLYGLIGTGSLSLITGLILRFKRD